MTGLAKAVRIAGLAALLVALSSTGCEDPVAGFTGLTVTTSSAEGHSHRVTVPAQHIDNPPTDGATEPTTSAGTPAHSHNVFLTVDQLRDLQQDGASVSVLTTSAGDPAHTHRCDFVR